MFADHFGLSREPFERSSDLDDACLPNTLAALLAELQATLRSPQGLSVFVAPSGSGKSMVAEILARRCAESDHVALVAQPFSSVTAVAREALSQTDSSAMAYVGDGDWVRALQRSITRRADAGYRTVLLLDDAQRLSSQTLDDLATLFGDDDSLPLHVFLFGQPSLLDRMNCDCEGGLYPYLLQISRLEPLSVRESVRYLERRVALCGGKLADLFNDDAMEEMVRVAEGRLLRLESLAATAFEHAAQCGARRVSLQDAREANAVALREATREESQDMASRQQPLRFELSGDGLQDEVDQWVAGDESEHEDAWVDREQEETAWHADEEQDSEEDEEESLEWESSTRDEEDEDDLPRGPSRGGVGQTDAARRMRGPAVLTLMACLGLVWAANQIPDRDEQGSRGRDSMIHTAPLSATPQQILRVAKTPEEADASEQVALWRTQPPRPVAVAAAKGGGVLGGRTSRPPAAPVVAPATVAKAAGAPVPTDEGPVAKASPEAATVSTTNAKASSAGLSGSATRTVASAKSSSAKLKVASKASPRPAAQSVSVSRSAGRGGTVFTVQLGAFKAKQNAEELVLKLRGKSPRILQEGGLYRVVSGSFPSKRDASAHEASLQRAGYSTYVRTASF